MLPSDSPLEEGALVVNDPGVDFFRRTLLVTCLVLVSLSPVYGEYPLIEELNRSDLLFAQLQEDIQRSRQASQRGSDRPPLFLFRYNLQPDDSFFRLSSRTTLPQSTLATINRLRSADLPTDIDAILIPNQPGVFVPLQPHTDLEYMLSARLSPEDVEEQQNPFLTENDPFLPPQDPDRNGVAEGSGDPRDHYQLVTITVRNESLRFAFFPGTDFSADERRAFLGVLFRSPVEFTRMSSAFGARIHPFTNRPSYHTGVDLVAPEGTPVRAAREGSVAAAGWDPVYGYYVIIEHDEIFTSFYGHLRSIHSELNANVTSGMIIGEVGNTGLSTGPHLHFEIRVRGTARDPVQFLHGFR